MCPWLLQLRSIQRHLWNEQVPELAPRSEARSASESTDLKPMTFCTAVPGGSACVAQLGGRRGSRTRRTLLAPPSPAPELSLPFRLFLSEKITSNCFGFSHVTRESQCRAPCEHFQSLPPSMLLLYHLFLTPSASLTLCAGTCRSYNRQSFPSLRAGHLFSSIATLYRQIPSSPHPRTRQGRRQPTKVTCEI